MLLAMRSRNLVYTGCVLRRALWYSIDILNFQVVSLALVRNLEVAIGYLDTLIDQNAG